MYECQKVRPETNLKFRTLCTKHVLQMIYIRTKIASYFIYVLSHPFGNIQQRKLSLYKYFLFIVL